MLGLPHIISGLVGLALGTLLDEEINENTDNETDPDNDRYYVFFEGEDNDGSSRKISVNFPEYRKAVDFYNSINKLKEFSLEKIKDNEYFEEGTMYKDRDIEFYLEEGEKYKSTEVSIGYGDQTFERLVFDV